MEEEKVEAIPCSQPDTQTFNFNEFTSPFVEAGTKLKTWGTLISLVPTLPTIRLTEDKYLFGRSAECDIIVKTLPAPWNRCVAMISKKHFSIERKTVDHSNPTEVTFTSLSLNKACVDNVLVTNTCILSHNSGIQLNFPNRVFPIYIYVDEFERLYKDDISKEVKMKYVVSNSLGSGATGVVRLAVLEETGEKFAMKIVHKNMGANNVCSPGKIEREIEILQKLNRPCVVGIKDVFDSPSATYIVLEFMAGGDLLSKLMKKPRPTELSIKVIFYQLVQAIQYLHNSDIVHRDIKPENILLANNEEYPLVKITDFGLSKIAQRDSTLKSFCGTVTYVAPEVLSHRGKPYTKKVDVWSLGVVLYCSLSGIQPFQTRHVMSVSEQIMCGMFHFRHAAFDNVSHQAINLVQRMMTVDPEKRVSIEEILNDPWLQDQKMLDIVQGLMKNANLETTKRTQNEDSVPPQIMKKIRISELGDDV